MGVPAFFRWLSKKYPSVIVSCVEEKSRDGCPVDLTQANPNGVEFDNLYLDMNGIIHPCTHPEDKPAPQSEDEMMIAIFEAIDRLMAIVRPRKLLYMAIDGVAPRAKMNQQRSRRFRASKESHEKVIEMSRIRSELEEKGCMLPPEKQKNFHFDSNCITPGTPFMWRLSKCLSYYVHDRMNSNPGWQKIKVVLSDANCPGEGEHKIMDYIRRQRASPDHDPNTHHCLCGADADLIMLGLATHEPNFTIIREEFKPNKPRPCDICGQMGHEMAECKGLARPFDSADSAPIGDEQKFIFVRLNVLREYLQRELEMPNLPFPYDFERAVDDWVFMCFFVGNDFLPHLPSLEIREGAIDRLVGLYKNSVYKTGGFLTQHGVPTMSRVQLILSDLGKVEDVIFVERQQRELDFKARDKNKKKAIKREKRMREADIKPSFVPEGQFAPVALGRGNNPGSVQNIRDEARDMRMRGMHTSTRGGFGRGRGGLGYGAQVDDVSSDEEEKEPPDEVRLYEAGFKDRYYESKFDVGKEYQPFRHQVGGEYAHGLCWVLRYYFQGCPSWKWFFPFHYAPFASDFVDVGSVSTEFEKGTKPFLPMEQLMGVFPAASRAHVPIPFGELMMDPDSAIIDFYPEDFKIDLNGKKYAWQGVALLPFVEETRLKKSLKPLYDQLTQEEIQRNVRGDDRLFVHKQHPSFKFIIGLYEGGTDYNMEVTMDPKMFDGVSGTIMVSRDHIEQGGTLDSVIEELDPIVSNNVATVRYRDPKFPPGHVFKAQRLPGAIDPPKVLKPGDKIGGDNRGRGRGRGRGGGRDWYPTIGMAPHQQRGSLDQAGHRMVKFHQGGQYGNVPPPMHDRGGGGGGGWGDRRGGFHGRGGRGSQYQRRDNWDQGRRQPWRN